MQLKWFSNRSWVAALSLGALLVAGCAFGMADHLTQAGNQPATVRVAPESPNAPHGYSAVVKQVLPAVVNISSSKMVKQENARGMMPPGMDPFFRQFFGDQGPSQREQREKGLGSGVIISPEGYILTNNHVIDGATEITVTLRDKREFKAKVVGADPRTDVAVLKIAGDHFPTLMLADSSKVEVGDIVLAVGNPFGVGQTVTMGIISAKGRGGMGIEQVEDFIQTDAPINPGNSGGALVDEQGHLVGINTAILGNSGGSQGIGFAVPINLARHDMDQIIEHGKVERAYLGILPQDVTPTLAKAFGSETKGALVGEVTPDSPAAKANLKAGDIILDINGQAVDDANQLRLKIGMLPVGSDAKLSVLRDGAHLTMTAKLTSFPEKEEHASLDTNSKDTPLQGVAVDNLTPEVARSMKLNSQTKGVVVQEVNPASSAAESGLQPGDVIQEVNHHAVRNVEDFNRALSESKKDTPVLLLVNHEGNTIFMAVNG